MKKKDLSPLYVLIESHLDMKEVERILLLLEKDRTDFNAIYETYLVEKKEISFIEKINPFSEREQKGEVLKLKVQLEDISGIYMSERQQIMDMSARAILEVPAFVAKDRYLKVVQGIDEIWATGPKGASIHGQDAAKQKAVELSKSLVDIYGADFSSCPDLGELLETYLEYLFAPFSLPQELEI